MSLAVILVSVLLGLFFRWEGMRAQEAEIRGRAYTIGSIFSSISIEDIMAENVHELSRKAVPVFLNGYGPAKGQDILYLAVYSRSGKLLFGRTRSGSVNGPDAAGPADGDVPKSIDAASQAGRDLIFRRLNGETYDLILPVYVEDLVVGFVKLGLSTRGGAVRFGVLTAETLSVLMAILLLGLVFSQVIAAGIVKPIGRLNTAIDELGKQNWQTPIPVKGTDELSHLATAFNEMATTLKQREASLARGNRDLFILHAAGLDLMESLDLETLLGKISARAEDLVRADTTSVALVDRSTRTLRYIGVTGSKTRALRSLELPLEAGGIFNWLASYGTPLLIPEAQADFRLDAEQMESLGIRSLMAVPLWSSNTMMAILTVVNKKGGEPFGKYDLRLLTVFSNMAGAALQKALLYDDLKQNVDELKRTHQQLMHSTKMAAIGELAANVAHEINNPLTSVLGYTTHLLKTLDVPEESRHKLRMMEQETLRVRKIIRNLLDFSRQRTPLIQPGDVIQPLRETVMLLHGAAERASVRIIERYPGSSVTVDMDHNEIKQVFLNIMNNALHAMPNGGELLVRVETTMQHESVVELSDTGQGIPREHLVKIFEPFFSTKGDGDGTGLGLSISERIIQSHGGRIEVESEVGRGTLFRIVLPLHEKMAVKG